MERERLEGMGNCLERQAKIKIKERHRETRKKNRGKTEGIERGKDGKGKKAKRYCVSFAAELTLVTNEQSHDVYVSLR